MCPKKVNPTHVWQHQGHVTAVKNIIMDWVTPSFTLQDHKLSDVIASGVIISNRSLVLQRVTRKAAGLFACRATNAEGHTTSNKLQLDVKCKPKKTKKTTTNTTEQHSFELFEKKVWNKWKSLDHSVEFDYWSTRKKRLIFGEKFVKLSYRRWVIGEISFSNYSQPEDPRMVFETSRCCIRIFDQYP